jgi:hypothetical protein
MGFETATVFVYSEIPAGAFKCCRFVVTFDKDRRDEFQKYSWRLSQFCCKDSNSKSHEFQINWRSIFLRWRINDYSSMYRDRKLGQSQVRQLQVSSWWTLYCWKDCLERYTDGHTTETPTKSDWIRPRGPSRDSQDETTTAHKSLVAGDWPRSGKVLQNVSWTSSCE